MSCSDSAKKPKYKCSVRIMSNWSLRESQKKNNSAYYSQCVRIQITSRLALCGSEYSSPIAALLSLDLYSYAKVKARDEFSWHTRCSLMMKRKHSMLPPLWPAYNAFSYCSTNSIHCWNWRFTPTFLITLATWSATTSILLVWVCYHS